MCPHGPQPPYPKDEDIHVVTKDVMADPSSPPPELRVVTVRHIQFHLSPIVADEIERLRKQTEVQPLLLEDAYAKWIRKTVPSDNHFTTFRAGFEAAQRGGIMWNCPCGASNDHDSVVCHACCRNRPAAEPSRDPAKRCQHDLLKPRSTVVVAAHGKSAICGVCLESWAIGAVEPTRDAEDAARWRFVKEQMNYSFDGEHRTHYMKAEGRETFEETVDRRRGTPENRPAEPALRRAEKPCGFVFGLSPADNRCLNCGWKVIDHGHTAGWHMTEEHRAACKGCNPDTGRG